MSYEYVKNGMNIDGEFIPLEKIIDAINNIKIYQEDLVLLTIDWPSHRGFDGATERIVLPKEKAVKLKEMITGVNVYFGEIAGKHSEVYGDLESNEMTIGSPDDFLKEHPGGREYNHSFLNAISDSLSEEPHKYDFTSEEFEKLIYN